MPKRIITPEHEKEMIKLGNAGMNAAQIAKQLGLKYHTVHSHMNQNFIHRALGKRTRQRTKDYSKISETMFNVHGRENWLV